MRIVSTSMLFLLVAARLGTAQSDFPSIDSLKEEQIITLELYAASPARPALGHQLHNDRVVAIQRNAAIHYLRALHRYRTQAAGIKTKNEVDPKNAITTWDDPDVFDLWMNAPVDEMPLQEMKEWVEHFHFVFEELERASNSSHCDWQVLPAANEKDVSWIDINIDEIQAMLMIARLISVAIRVNIAESNLEEAIAQIKLGFTLAIDVEKTDMIIGGLIASTCGDLMKQQVLTLLQRKHAPNLYWPLVDLPQPLVSFRDAIRKEISMYLNKSYVEFLREPEAKQLNVEGWRQVLLNDMRQVGFSYQGYQLERHLAVSGLKLYPAAKQFLLSRGYSEDQIGRMPALQVIAIQQELQMEIALDDVKKYLNLPLIELIQLMNELEKQLNAEGHVNIEVQQSAILPYVQPSLPAFENVLRTELRSHRQLVAVRLIEAIRAHAATTGELPKSLDEIKVVPVPRNPATDRPFDYRWNGDVAELADFGLLDHSRVLYRIHLKK